MDKVSAIQKQKAEWTEKREQLTGVEASAAQRVAFIEEQRALHLVGALTGNREAQENLQRLNGELETAMRDYSDASDAIDQVSEKLASLTDELELAAREEKREAICGLIKRRIEEKREQRVADAAGQLERELNELKASNREITLLVREFDAEIGTHAQHLEQMQSEPVRVDYGNRGRAPLAYFVGSTPGILTLILRRVESLPLDGQKS